MATGNKSESSNSESSKPGTFSTIINGTPIITSEKLKGESNYKSWAASVRLWFKGQGHSEHLTKRDVDISEIERPKWVQIDAQLCSLLWHSIDPTLLPVYQPNDTCYDVWNKAASVYSNDIQRFYDVLSNFVNLKHQDMDTTMFVSKIEALIHEFKSLMPTSSSASEQEAQWDKLFMVMTLINLRPDLDVFKNQILGESTIPKVSDVLTRLVRISASQSKTINNAPITDSSALVSQRTSGGGNGRNNGRKRPQCTHCNKLGHTRDRCWDIYGRPSRPVNVAQQDTPVENTLQSNLQTGDEYQEFLKYQRAKQTSIAASVAQTSNVTACFARSPDIGPWVLDSGASEHISGNRNLFNYLSYSRSLPLVTLANGCKVAATGIGQVQILPSLFVDSVLYVPQSSFNLVSVSKLIQSHNCSITFTDQCVSIQDRSTGRTIGVGRESQGLYHLSPPASPVACVTNPSPSLIHNRLGHPNISKLHKMDTSLSTLSSLPCESCQLGKQTRSSFPRSLNNRTTSPFQLVHSDVWGPSRVSSVSGFQYFITFIDDYSHCTWLYMMKSRSEVFNIFQNFCSEIKTQFNTSVSILRSDNAKEYLSTPFKTFMSSQGILHQTSCPHTPQQNGVAERKNRHLIETARTLLIHHNVPITFWSDAVLTACYLINRMPSSVLNDQVPHSLLFPNEPLYHLPLRVFGCVCFVHDLTPGKDKLAAKSIKCVFLGYSRFQKGYRCYCPSTRRCFISPDVTFFESSPFFTSSTSGNMSVSEALPVPCLPPPQDLSPDTSSPPFLTYHRRPRPALPDNVPDSLPSSDSPDTLVPPLPDSPPIAIRKGIRSTRNPHPVYNFLSYHRLSVPYYAFVSTLDSVSIPKTTDEALAHPGWRQAMLDEMSALHSNGTWELVSLPSGKSPVGCRWVYAVKVGPDGQVERLKARLVAKGYTQIYGLDYGDTFSPVAKIASVRVFLSIAAINHWPLYQLDIKNAFLNGDLEEEVYMEQPPGFVAQGETGKVCRLRRSLYGLKQSPRAWFGRFSSVVLNFGMTRSEADHSVFFRHTSQGKCIYLVVYVDDIVITGNDDSGIVELKQHLCNHFQTKDLGKLKYFLGIEVAQSSTGVAISQRKYALDLLEETGMINCKPVDTPMDPNVKLYPGQGEQIENPERYRRLVGKLNYLTITRPDISFAVSVVSQFLQSPCDSHWDAVVRILRYIKGAPGQGLLYEDKGNSLIVGFTDADWAGSPDDRRSTSGYCVFLGGNLVSWKSKKQNVVARSSAEAEYRAMALATCELLWLKQLLQEIKIGNIDKMELICDNQAAMHIASNPVFHERTKHIEIDCHFIREKIQSGCLTTRFVNSNDQLADIFTKSLRGPRIKYICNKLGAYDLYAPA